jgi:glycosyltransferase involved in cell wall biosynthesis
MRIGIDVHSVGSGKGGNETYYRCLIKALAAEDTHNDYLLYATHASAVRAVCKSFQNSTIREINPASPYFRIPFGIPLQVRNSVDVYHAQFIVPPFLKCKTVATIPDIAFEHVPEMFSPYQRAWSKLLIRRSAVRADHVITVSERSKSDLVDTYGISPERITVTYLAAGDEFYPRPKQEARQFISQKHGISREFILYLGRLQGRKNLLTLVNSFARLRKAGCTHQLVLAGKKDTYSSQLVEAIKSSALREEIHLPGFIPSADLPWLYNAADAFVYPSLYEGFGLPVLEAMACGVSVITSYDSAMEEIAADAALMVDPLDDLAIANALTRVLQDMSLRTRLFRSGLQRSACFSYRRTGEETIGVYEKVCGMESRKRELLSATERRLCS